jgi:hypothetical protein
MAQLDGTLSSKTQDKPAIIDVYGKRLVAPTAPTILQSFAFPSFPAFAASARQHFATEPCANMLHVDVQNPCRGSPLVRLLAGAICRRGRPSSVAGRPRKVRDLPLRSFDKRRTFGSDAVVTDGRLFEPKNVSRLTAFVIADRFHLRSRR